MHDRPECLGPFPLPGQPTDALPGTERKIRILIERAQRKEPLFHPLDGLNCPTLHMVGLVKEESA
jgi:hypothetical protein